MERFNGSKENPGEERSILSISQTVVLALREKPLPQRQEGCGAWAGFYRNISDEELPWYDSHLKIMLGLSEKQDGLDSDFLENMYGQPLSPDIRSSLIKLFGQVIVSLRQGKSLEIVVDTQQK